MKLIDIKSVDRQATTTIAIVIFIMLFAVRITYVQIVHTNFSFYVRDYYRHLKKTNEDMTYQDIELMEEKLIPNYWLTIANIFKWTERQISEDDELLIEAKEAWIMDEREGREKEKVARKTFEKRYDGWTMGKPKL